jgi:putative oxidoreductase
MQKFLQLDFIPRSADFGLLVLRVWLGAAMAVLHGWGKAVALFSGKNPFEHAIIGIPPWPAFILATVAEFVAAIFVIIGLWTRFAALWLIVTMAVAFFVAHGAKLSGPGSGEIAFLYLGGFLVILFAGAGKFSVDKR